MWSPKGQLGVTLRLVCAAGIGLLASGCFRPLYGPTASGIPLQEALASIEVAPVTTPLSQERLGSFLRTELIFELDGSGQPRPKRYRLALEASEQIQAATVDTITGRADAATLLGTVRYTLKTLDGTTIVTSGTARASATYYRDLQRFASVRAARDAEMRVARQIADDLKQRLAAFFATTS